MFLIANTFAICFNKDYLLTYLLTYLLRNAEAFRLERLQKFRYGVPVRSGSV